MKKVTTLALVALLAVAGAAFAGERFAGIEANATFASGSPATTNNDDSCDIGVAPAATLLLPYFEVDVVNTAGTGETTLFAITNTSRDPQIAHVTLWTDWSFPVLDFNIFLTGYDVQTINLYDVIVRGVVAPQTGTRTDTDLGVRGGTGAASTTRSAENDSRVGVLINLDTCPQLPGQLPDVLVRAVRAALTTGLYQLPTPAGCGTSGTASNTKVGGTHANAIGYLTVDVINNPCSTALPTSYSYFSTEILFDNVLVGDFQQVNGDTVTGNYAQGNPMVHIRAIPEGGNVGLQPTNLPYTFYDRYTNGAPNLLARKVDRRQPLPSTFAARWIEGGPGAFNTSYKIWREGFTGGGTQTCGGAESNSALPIREIVRFDERENWAVTSTSTTVCSPYCTTPTVGIPETSNIPTSNTSVYPAKFGADLSGWMYLNLHNNVAASLVGATLPYSVNRASQNWAIVSMKAEGRYSVDFDAAWLGNGCSAVAVAPTTLDATNPIAPARDIP